MKRVILFLLEELISERKLVKLQRSSMPKEIYTLPVSPCCFYCKLTFKNRKQMLVHSPPLYSILNKIKNMSLDYIKLEDQFIELEGAVSTI